MDISTLENWLWDAACSIRGPLDAPKFKDYILPLMFYKRLSDVYKDELASLTAELGDEDLVRALADTPIDKYPSLYPLGGNGIRAGLLNVLKRGVIGSDS